MSTDKVRVYEVVRRRLHGEKNESIAREMGIDAAEATRALKKAFDLGILKLCPPQAVELAEELKSKMRGLRAVRVVQCAEHDPNAAREAVAEAAVPLLEDRAEECWAAVGRRFNMAVSGGRSVVSTLRLLEGFFDRAAGIASSHAFAAAAAGSGARTASGSNYSVGLIKMLNPSLNAVAFPVAPIGESAAVKCPPLDRTDEVVEFLRKSLGDYAAKAYETLLSTTFHLILTGIGNCRTPGTTFAEELDEIAPHYLQTIQQREDIVGELMLQPITSGGEAVYPSGLPQPYLSIPLARIAQLIQEHGTTVCLLAPQPETVRAIKASYGKYFNVLVCSEAVARALREIL